MTREELIEQRKGMTNEEVIKAVIGRMVHGYVRLFREVRKDCQMAEKKDRGSEEAHEARVLLHEIAVKRNVLNDLLETLDERCSDYVNGIDCF